MSVETKQETKPVTSTLNTCKWCGAPSLGSFCSAECSWEYAEHAK